MDLYLKNFLFVYLGLFFISFFIIRNDLFCLKKFSIFSGGRNEIFFFGSSFNPIDFIYKIIIILFTKKFFVKNKIKKYNQKKKKKQIIHKKINLIKN